MNTQRMNRVGLNTEYLASQEPENKTIQQMKNGIIFIKECLFSIWRLYFNNRLIMWGVIHLLRVVFSTLSWFHVLVLPWSGLKDVGEICDHPWRTCGLVMVCVQRSKARTRKRKFIGVKSTSTEKPSLRIPKKSKERECVGIGASVPCATDTPSRKCTIYIAMVFATKYDVENRTQEKRNRTPRNNTKYITEQPSLHGRRERR